jgi:hypothetical protein
MLVANPLCWFCRDAAILSLQRLRMYLYIHFKYTRTSLRFHKPIAHCKNDLRFFLALQSPQKFWQWALAQGLYSVHILLPYPAQLSSWSLQPERSKQNQTSLFSKKNDVRKKWRQNNFACKLEKFQWKLVQCYSDLLSWALSLS